MAWCSVKKLQGQLHFTYFILMMSGYGLDNRILISGKVRNVSLRHGLHIGFGTTQSPVR
jgi:hypothetical protein